MLHFLIVTALCIWIAERVTHYWMGWREDRQLARALRTPRAASEPRRGLIVAGALVFIILLAVTLHYVPMAQVGSLATAG